jgi:hypothetical protein
MGGYAVQLGATWVAVAGTIGGLVAGLFAPFVTQAAGAHTARRGAQADIARAALQIFEGDQSLEALLCGRASSARRRLFLLANQLRSGEARRACVALVAVAGADPVDHQALDASWTDCIRTLGEVARSA